MFHQLLVVGRWFPPGTPVSSTRKLISSLSFHRLEMTLASGGGTKKKVGGLTLPLNDCTEAGVQGPVALTVLAGRIR